MPDSISVRTTTITIQGLEFPYEPRYAQGHQCSEAEAQALDTVTAENIRNNFARHIIRLCEEHKVGKAAELPVIARAKLAADFAAYAKAYHIGLRATQKADPIAMLARKLAREAVLIKLRSLGVDPKSKPSDWLDAQVERALAANGWFIEEAERRINAAREAAAQVVSLEL